MITDDSLDNLQVRGFPFRGMGARAIALPSLLTLGVASVNLPILRLLLLNMITRILG